MPDRPNEAEMLAYMLDLKEVDDAGERLSLLVGPYTALVLVGGLQLATRHPAIPDAVRAQLLAMIGQFRALFAGTPGEHIIDRGNDPQFDRGMDL